MVDIGTFLRVLCASMCAFVVAFSSSAGPLPREGVFIYSNLCWEKGSGDAAGYRIRIDRSSGIDSLYFEWSEGGLMGGHATNLTIQPKTGALDFTVLPDGWPSNRRPVYRYTGKVSEKGVLLEKVDFGSGRGFEELQPETHLLPPTLNLSNDLPICR